MFEHNDILTSVEFLDYRPSQLVEFSFSFGEPANLHGHPDTWEPPTSHRLQINKVFCATGYLKRNAETESLFDAIEKRLLVMIEVGYFDHLKNKWND